MIIIQPHSGLANRIRVIISGLNLSEKNTERLVILWSKDDSLFCNFEDIFELNDKFKLVNISNFARALSFVRSKKNMQKLFCYLFNIKNFILDKDIPNLVWSTGTNNIDFNKLSNKAGNAYFFTCHEFFFDSNKLKFLNPTIQIRKEIAAITCMYTKNTIGIHIRRTDNKEAIEKSPIELFLKAIENEILKDPETLFFLATDDIETELLLKTRFENKILTNQKEFLRINENGIKGAMVDLYSLSATQKIYGSYNSSFSEIASRIGNIPLVLVSV
jgi:hypothetical protein